MMRILSAILTLLPLLAWAAPEYGTVERDHIRAELVAEASAIEPGQSFWAGLRLEPDENWHTYWINPGDSGIPTTLDWQLPGGVIAGEIGWPWPEALQMGHLVNYGYKGEHLLPVRIGTPDTLNPGDTVTLVVDAAWLVCEEICIPGDVRLALDIDVVTAGKGRDSNHAGLFADTLQRVPEKADWSARFSADGGSLSVQVVPEDIALDRDWAFFAINDNLVEHAEVPSVLAEDGQILVSQPLSAYFAGVPERLEFVLIDTNSERAWQITAEPGELLSAGALVDSSAPGWALALILALAGGVLLNLMPCVFPVLSIKAMSLVSGAGHDQRAHGLAYTAGVVVSFAVLAGVLLALRAGGEAIGWGFQLQSAWFVALLVYILFALGLSLSGLFDFGTRLMGVGQGLTEKSGARGSFFTGVLACVVASPCTAPFMGAALGAAVFMPWPMAITVFLALGLGLALPMLVLSFSPALAARLPRPGPWMDTFKQAMAFPLYLAVVWLLWVLARQTDATGLALVLSGMVVLAFALWVGGRRAGNESLTVARHAAVGLSLVFVVSTLVSANRFGDDAAPIENAHWEAYSPETLATLRQDPERAVLVNMTADWCITCLVNERMALNTPAVREAMAEHDVVYLKGDWTRRDAAITEYLSSYDRNGVPLYVLYPRNGDEPRVLPQVLTPQLVIQALERS
jgi:thiol:disulfide interchange protein/DsbC/DsbD-like thiol-disulfide interchange protein